MRNWLLLASLCVIVVVLPAPAQEYGEGAVWDITFVGTKPNQRDAYLTSLKNNAKPILDEEKKQGLIVNYRIFNNLTQHDPAEWDVAIAVEYKNFAALDGFEAKEIAIRDRLAGSKAAAAQVFVEKHGEMREIVSTKLVQELILK